MVPAENFCATLHVNVDNEKLTDADFREFVRNTLPIVEYKFSASPDFQQMEPPISPYTGPDIPVQEDNKPPVPTEPQTCKFCEFTWPAGEDHACESGSDYDAPCASFVRVIRSRLT